MEKEIGMRRGCSIPALAGVVLCMLGASGGAHAFSIDTGNPDIDLRWDNTISYTGGVDAGYRSMPFYNNGGFDETEGRFTPGNVVTSRFDFLSEFDMKYKERYGFRVSASAWYDPAYTDHTYPNPNLPGSGNYRNNKYNSYASRYILGPSGELLDAFVFGKFDLGGTTLNLKVGQHNVYWGESIYSTTNSIAYSQGPIDTIKAATDPGAEAKELFLPLNQISAQLQVNEHLSVAAQYYFDWRPYRLVPGGTYFATADATRADFASPGVPWGSDLEPRDSGQFGINTRWSPDWLSGTVGLYYRRFNEMLPWSFTQVNVLTGAATERLNYARYTQLFGLSLTKNLGPVSVGSELSFRKNAALNSVPGYVVLTTGDASYNQAEGARGNTMHALVNGIWLLPHTPLFESGTFTAELTYSHLMSVTANPNLYFGVGYACPAGKSKWDGCSTRDSVATTVAFTPEWDQVFPGWDVNLPIVVGYQIYGNGAALGGGNQGVITGSIGVKATLRNRYIFSLLFSDSYARYSTNASNVANPLFNSTDGPSVLNGHAVVFASFKTTF
ncbi:DUF1302 family protein [Paraburkholderia phymatum]|uniref:DUF1302 domain-containing protein n=1 Tax=Paraburkholderia phymatum TaxID=148447 RepID=UPI00317FC0E9